MRWLATTSADPISVVRQLTQPLVAKAVSQLAQLCPGSGMAMLVVVLADPDGVAGGTEGATYSSSSGSSASDSALQPPLQCQVLCKPAQVPAADDAVQVRVPP